MHSKQFDNVKRFYDLKIYNKSVVADFVFKGVITRDEYFEIIGETI